MAASRQAFEFARGSAPRALAAALLMGMPVALARCGGDTHPAGSITIAQAAQPDFLDPALSNTLNGQEPMWLVYTPLLTYRRAEGKAGTELIPGLARELPRISADGRTYRLRLRRGVTYSDGRPVKASDFEHTIQRVLTLKSGGSSFFLGIEGADAYLHGGRPNADIRGVRTDDRTGAITIRLRAPDATFSNALATNYAGVVPGDAPFANLTKRPPPGVGPYRIVRSRPNLDFVMARNKDFHIPGIPAGKVDRITTKIETNTTRQAEDVLRGKLDYMQEPPPDDLLPRIRSKDADRYREFVTAATSYFFLNTRTPPFDKLDVRRAVNYALDRRAFVRLSGGLLQASCNFLPPTVPGYRKMDPCPYGDPTRPPNIRRAKALVDRAGAHGAGVKVWGPQQEPGPKLVNYYADALNRIGLKARVELIDFAVYGQVLGSESTGAQTGYNSWTEDFPHPFSFFRQFAGSAITKTSNINLGNVSDPEIDAGLARLNREPDLARVEDRWASLDRRLVERAYVAIIGHPKRTTFLSARMDFDHCSRVHPVYDNDYSSFCVK